MLNWLGRDKCFLCPGTSETKMSRERVIVDKQNLEQALRLEQNVRTGYCDPIAENLVARIAVEEDLASSYEKLGEKYPDSKNAITDLSGESRKNIELLRGILKSIESFSQTLERREELIEKIISQKSIL